MYDSYSIFSPLVEIKQVFNCENEIALIPTYLASPAQLLPVILAGSEPKIHLHHWGVPQELAKGKSVSSKLINLPIEQGLARPTYRKMIEQKRCVIPSNGFFLWKQIGKKQKTPHFCHLAQNSVFGIAGIWDVYENRDGSNSYTFNMILTDTTNHLQNYQALRPAILTREVSKEWLNQDMPLENISDQISQFSETDLLIHAVSPTLLKSNENTENVIQAALPADQFGNYTLFS